MINNDYPLNTLNQLRPLLIVFRKANGLTQKDLSERLGVTQQAYSRLEANPASASIERLYKVFSILSASPRQPPLQRESRRKKCSNQTHLHDRRNNNNTSRKQQRLAIWMNGIKVGYWEKVKG